MKTTGPSFSHWQRPVSEIYAVYNVKRVEDGTLGRRKPKNSDPLCLPQQPAAVATWPRLLHSPHACFTLQPRHVGLQPATRAPRMAAHNQPELRAQLRLRAETHYDWTAACHA